MLPTCRFLYPNYASADEVWANEGDWHGAIPTVVGMANVLVNRDGLLWNEKVLRCFLT